VQLPPKLDCSYFLPCVSWQTWQQPSTVVVNSSLLVPCEIFRDSAAAVVEATAAAGDSDAIVDARAKPWARMQREDSGN